MDDIEMKKRFAENLKNLLYTHDMTQKQAADAVGVSPQTFNTWTQGKAIPRMGKIQKLADMFRVPKSELIDFGRDTEKSYYLDPDVAAAAQRAYDDPDTRMLLDAKRDLSKDDFDYVVGLVKRLRNGGQDE